MADANSIERPKGTGLDAIWKIFVGGLIAFVLIGLVFIGVIITFKGDPGALVTLTTAGLTGLIGVFVPQPAK